MFKWSSTLYQKQKYNIYLFHYFSFQGKKPFCVNATAGTTVSGAYDPLDDIADVCQKHGLWMHVDAAWGGGALLSNKYKHLCKGLHR